MFSQHLLALSGLAATALFLLALKRMSSPTTAVSGNIWAGIGMVIVVSASFLEILYLPEAAGSHLIENLILVATALLAGGTAAWWSGRKVAITAIPQMVALFNGMGAGAAAAIAAVELSAKEPQSHVLLTVTVAGALIGSISVTGSLIAWAKLDERIKKPWRFGGQRVVNALLFLSTVALAIAVVTFYGEPLSSLLAVLVFVCALLLGVMMTLPIGGADMPVVISLFNALTGLAVALEGYALQNPALMVAGTGVGSAGTLLTVLMARAMNRSLANVLFSNFGEAAAGGAGVQGQMKSIDAGDAGINMRYASSVMIIPGYGLAVAQAQHKLYEFVKLLTEEGVSVKFAIHPVAGRMPGHMDVLLAEAGVPYDLIHDMDAINDDFAGTDVALVIGANDIVNPAARTDKSSPIYGMPILNADRTRQVYVVKRGQGKGYSGVENLLFYEKNCTMVYGDAQAVMTQMVQAVKNLGTSTRKAA